MSLRLVALVNGVVGLTTFALLVLFFAVGGAFGGINDVGNAVLGILSGLLAVLFWRRGTARTPALAAACVLAVTGSVVAVVGSVLVIWNITGYFLAGLVSSAGFALIGLWLVPLSRSLAAEAGQSWPRRLPVFGVVSGVVMALGLIGVPGIVAGYDDINTVPGWILAGGANWLGTYILFPLWCLRVSRSPAARG